MPDRPRSGVSISTDENGVRECSRLLLKNVTLRTSRGRGKPTFNNNNNNSNNNMEHTPRKLSRKYARICCRVIFGGIDRSRRKREVAGAHLRNILPSSFPGELTPEHNHGTVQMYVFREFTASIWRSKGACERRGMSGVHLVLRRPGHEGLVGGYKALKAEEDGHRD
ncbi:unnamed protein product [Scytosiphon promiscuus]